jgi:POT family proton-dependent oligopeptide transporter
MLKNHPKGIVVLFFVEMWERFGFYTLMAIFVLYMDKEFLWNDNKKGNLYGIFLALVYFIPIAGGWIGDKILGAKNTIRVGQIMLVIGYILVALSSIDRVSFFYIGLFLVALGTGIFKVNMSVSVGHLYTQNSALKDSGYNIYYMGVNLGAALAPLSATFFSIMYHSYNISFAAAAVGMLFSQLIFELGKKHLVFTEHKQTNKIIEQQSDETLISNRFEDKQRIVTLVILFAIVIFFWIGFYQNGFALTLFAERSTIVLGILRPETYQFFGPFFILTLTPLLLSFFTSLRKKGKEPTNPTKILYGMFISGFSMVIMIFAALAGGDLDQNIMSPSWLIISYFIVTIAEILVSPMGLSFVSKVAPRKIQGLMMGLWFSATAVGSYGSGLFGRFYSSFSHHDYFIILTVMLFLSSLLVFIFRKKLNRFSI